jgi:acyl-CoA synthetase (NDP forming)/GNAT superfamily N-acetyltransferase
MPDVLTADGRVVQIRPVRREDAEALERLYLSVGAQSRHSRFFSLGTQPIAPEVERLTRDPADDHLALVAEESGHLIGVASYERDESAQAEFAVLVADECHGRGVGTLLVEQLAAGARTHGIATLTGDVLSTNTMMLRVAAGLAPSAEVEHDAGIARVRIATDFDSVAIDALDARERTAEEHSLRPLLAPHSVAVVGAGREAGGIGREILSNILGHGFTGRVYAVNPHLPQIEGCLTYPALSAIPEAIDLVVIAVPAPMVANVLRDAGHAGARTAVVITAGFSETGDPEAQHEILRIAREHGMRLVGPNCLGVLNTDPGVRLAATFASELPAESGGLAVATQSGAVGIAVLDHAARSRMGISTFVSLGNKADISGNDLLSYWFGDPATRAVALYLESFGNPRKFARIARAVARRKPVLAVKGGRSAEGQRAGASHTAAAAAPDVAVDSLFAQAGVIRTETLGEMLDTARVLVDQPLPAGQRVGLVGNAGGLNVLAADAAASAGLTVPMTETPGGNPFDLGAGATALALGQAVRAMAASGEVDAIVAIFGATRSNDPFAAMAEIADAADDFPQLPIAVVLVGVDDCPAFLGKRRRAPVFGLPEQAMKALGHAARYAEWRRSPLGSRPPLPDVDHVRARSTVDSAVPGWQPWQVAADLLASYGIPVLPSLVASDADEAVAAAEKLGFPVVLKAADPDLVHKSDLGLVRLDLTDAGAVAAAYRAIAGASPNVLVQPMRGNGVELVAGVVHDPLFGSLLMTGLGGIHTDLLGDRSFQLLPVTDLDAAAMWRRLRAARLLTGYRGRPACDTAALEDVLLRLGRLAEDFPEIAELDLNPVLAFPDGIAAVDVKLRLSAVGAEPDPTQRILRS